MFNMRKITYIDTKFHEILESTTDSILLEFLSGSDMNLSNY